ncbi:hypothetical protein [Paraburkholderia tagetis]|uniref:Uncharacterized protein n=1 Tax=Paraburkholderia tagetis TaxID=2913261 RepID=A0A9X1RTM9_9BURK|nr:hypothetical protein [Paraburkholderia tagetis]MCG5074704.1 hypothetical protein [Paraburkholderia tagetis]
MMSIGQIFILLALELGLMVGVRAEGLCEAGETVIFNCELPKSVSSLCQSENDGVLTYRNGANGKLNLKLSDKGRGKGRVFYFSGTPYAGGGEAHIRFLKSGYTYYLYDKAVKTGDGQEFSAGVVIYKASGRVANLVCNNDASIHETAYHEITKEAYQSIATQ